MADIISTKFTLPISQPGRFNWETRIMTAMKSKGYTLRILIILSFFIMTASCNNNGKTESTAFNTLLQVVLTGSVPTISVSEFSRIRDSATILDARKAEEYRVSRIPGAVHAGFDEFDISMMDNKAKDSPIIVYCSVGYRSEKIGEKLEEAGFENVRNLYGGIFEWVNQNQLIVDDNGRTDKIHPYNKFWSTWINNKNIDTATMDRR